MKPSSGSSTTDGPYSGLGPEVPTTNSTSPTVSAVQRASGSTGRSSTVATVAAVAVHVSRVWGRAPAGAGPIVTVCVIEPVAPGSGSSTALAVTTARTSIGASTVPGATSSFEDRRHVQRSERVVLHRHPRPFTSDSSSEAGRTAATSIPPSCATGAWWETSTS